MTCDNPLWGTVKENIFDLRLTTAEDLKKAIRDWFNYFCQYGRCPEEHGR